MIIHNPLLREMQRFFDLLSDFEIAADEQLALSAMRYPENLDVENGVPLVRRCANVGQVPRIALKTLGSRIRAVRRDS